MRDWACSLSILLLLVPGDAVVAGDEPTDADRSWTRAIKDGDLSIGLHYRFESVEDDAFFDDATASTLRTTLGYRSAAYRHFRIALEVEDVTDVGAGDLHDNQGAGSLWNGVTARPAIADPDITEMNQANLSYDGWRDTEIWLGRREIVLDDHRFVGNVGWRQNHQSFDGVVVEQGSIPRSALTYAYLDNVNTITGANRGLAGHALSVAIDAARAGTVTPYFLHLDFDSPAGSTLSTRTLGASLAGHAAVRGWTLPYRLELAQQDDAADNPGPVDAGYLRLEIGANDEHWSFGVGHETLEGSPGNGAFGTPLATLHKFNGWADKFTSTPADGLKDLYATVGYEWDRWSAVVVRHEFDADSGGASHGSEMDGQISYKSSWEQLFAVAFAVFEADGPAFTDTEKIWAYTSYTF